MRKGLALIMLAAIAAGWLIHDRLTAADHAGSRIRIATEGTYPPFNFVAEDGSLRGFDVDIALALCAEMGADCEMVRLDWDAMIPALQGNRVDAISASMSITADRQEKIGFSDCYYNTPVVLAARRDSPIRLDDDGNVDPDSLGGLKIGAQRGTIHAAYARNHLTGAEIILYDTADNANLDLRGGRIDARIDDILSLKDQLLTTDGGDPFRIYGKGFVGPELGAGVGIGVRRDAAGEKLAAEFSRAIRAIRADGTYQTINDRYFDFDLYGCD